jgi:hypothetical protein
VIGLAFLYVRLFAGAPSWLVRSGSGLLRRSDVWGQLNFLKSCASLTHTSLVDEAIMQVMPEFLFSRGAGRRWSRFGLLYLGDEATWLSP